MWHITSYTFSATPKLYISSTIKTTQMNLVSFCLQADWAFRAAQFLQFWEQFFYTFIGITYTKLQFLHIAGSALKSLKTWNFGSKMLHRCQSVQSFFMYLGCINLCHTWSWQLFFWLSWEQCICHPCSFYAGCLACYMLHFNGKNLISERSLKLVPLHTTIPTKGITNESQWSRSCQELPTNTATHPWPK